MKADHLKNLIPLSFALLLTGIADTASGQRAHESANATTVIPPSILEGLLEQEAGTPLSSNPLRVIESTDNRVGVYVLSSDPSSAELPATGGYHRNVSEVYHVINGSGIFLSGGVLGDPTEVQVGTTRYEQSGPGATGAITNGDHIEYSPGMVIIVPPGVPHNALYRVDTRTDYVVYRYDPNRLLTLE